MAGIRRTMVRQFIGALVLLTTAVTAGRVFAGPTDVLPPTAYVDPVDQQIVTTGRAVGGRQEPCYRDASVSAGNERRRIPWQQCVKMLPPQLWQGLWRNDFEGSQFCPLAVSDCHIFSMKEKIALEPGPMPGLEGALYRVEFIGRKTKYRGPYGHFGTQDHLMVVDRVIAIKMVRPPQPPWSRERFEAEYKRCQQAGNCD